MCNSVRLLCRSAVVPFFKGYTRQLNQTSYYMNAARVNLLVVRTLPRVSDTAIFQSPTKIVWNSVSPLAVGRQRLSTASKPGCDKGPTDPPTEKPSLYQRFKSMYKDYWYVLIPVHVVTSCMWVGCFYYVAQSGFDIAGALQILNLSDEIMEKVRHKTNSTAGHIALSYLLYKIFSPLRYTVTIGGTTFAIKYFTSKGLLKKAPRTQELKKMMENSKDSFKDKSDNLKKIVGKFSAPKKSN